VAVAAGVVGCSVVAGAVEAVEDGVGGDAGDAEL
jgi:hypothetical protein